MPNCPYMEHSGEPWHLLCANLHESLWIKKKRHIDGSKAIGMPFCT